MEQRGGGGTWSTFLAAWDEHAYQAAHQLEKAWLLPAGYCLHYFPEQHEARLARLDRAWHAMLLSGGNLAACAALLRGERVPANTIDRRYLNLNRRRAA